MGIDAQRADPKLLVVGGGGREHAICWRLRQDRPLAEIYCAPGNAGTADVARSLDIDAGDVGDLVSWARSERPDMVVVGPEDPLIKGIADELQNIGIPVFGPTRRAAEIEGSKSFSSDLVTRLGVPAPAHATFDDVDAALVYVQRVPGEVVVKADGPALGKGVIVCRTPDEAADAVQQMMVDGAFGASGARVVVQERLHGPELSLFALSDGQSFRTMGVARDYKRIGDGDQGAEHGRHRKLHAGARRARGACVAHRARNCRPSAGRPAGGGTTVCRRALRRADPHGRRSESDRIQLPHGRPGNSGGPRRPTGGLRGASPGCGRRHTGSHANIRPPREAAVAVVLTSEGYPGPSVSGRAITGLGEVDRGLVFHAGTQRRDGAVRTAGGRVLAAVGVADDLGAARDEAYAIAATVQFEGVAYRTDIAADALGVAVGL